MLKPILLLACPLLLLSACTIKIDGASEDDGTTAAENSEGNDSVSDESGTDPEVTTGPDTNDPTDPTDATDATDPTDPTAEPPPIDDPANDGCVPQDNAAADLNSPGVRAPTTDVPDFSGTTTGDTAGDTDTDTGTGTGGGTGTGTDTGDTAGEGGSESGGQECEPLPTEHPSKLDTNCECDVTDEHRACKTPDQQSGTRFCSGGAWGPCVVDPECMPGTYTVCFICDVQFGTWVSWCTVSGGVPHSDMEEDCATPLVLSFDGRAVEYTSAHAEFAMSEGDGCGARDWPTSATPWLAIDLDRNGNIDGGHELFGTGSRLAGRVDNGFAALAALDSNNDGIITPADDRFAEIVVWSDNNADRRSTHWELQPLTSHGVVAIDLGYQFDASRCDARGNCEGERASFVFETADGARSSGEIVDVRLSCQ